MFKGLNLLSISTSEIEKSALTKKRCKYFGSIFDDNPGHFSYIYSCKYLY